jgi:hypothetical protein
MEYCLAIKNNDTTLFADKWMELENIMLSKVRFRRTKVKYFVSSIEARSK